jgi:hypothetical protein
MALYDLNVNKEVLENWVENYFSIRLVGSINQTEDIGVLALKGSQSPKEIFDPYDILKNKIFRNDAHADPIEIHKIIKVTGIVFPEKLNGEFRNFWSEFTTNFDIIRNENKVPLAHVLKARTMFLAESDWKRKKDWLDTNQLSNIEQLVSDIGISAKSLGISKLLYGRSQFPEARIYGEILTTIFSGDKSNIEIVPVDLSYGNNTYKDKEVDLVLINEFGLHGEKLNKSPKIFTHPGYFVFVSRKFMESLNSTKYPKQVRYFCENALEERNTIRYNKKLDKEIRCWIAMEAGLSLFTFDEYKHIIKSINKVSVPVDNKVRNLNSSAWSKKVTFDQDFEDFIEGKKEVFIGGSVHARLLINWFNQGRLNFFPIIEPIHFEKIFENDSYWPPTDRLVFSHTIRNGKKSSEVELRERLISLFKLIGFLVSSVASESRMGKNEKADTFINNLMSFLSKNREDDMNLKDDWRWSFVADKKSMLQLILDDNNFKICNE